MNKIFVFSVILAFTAASIQMPAMAGMIDNNQLSMQSELQMQRDEVRSLLARDNVRSALLDYGVSAADVDNRINNMTESELTRIQTSMSSLPAGEGAAGTVLTILLILVLLEVLGVVDLFPRL